MIHRQLIVESRELTPNAFGADSLSAFDPIRFRSVIHHSLLFLPMSVHSWFMAGFGRDERYSPLAYPFSLTRPAWAFDRSTADALSIGLFQCGGVGRGRGPRRGLGVGVALGVAVGIGVGVGVGARKAYTLLSPAM